MTTIQRIVQLFGWAFVIIAIWGAVLTGTSMNADPATAPRLWGLFPLNFAHNLVHLAFGMWALLSARSYSAARTYALLAGALYILLAVLGVFFPRGFGLVPLGGHDVWLHLVLGAALLVVGLTVTSSDATTTLGAPRTRTVMPPSPGDDPGTTDPGTAPPPGPDRGGDPRP